MSGHLVKHLENTCFSKINQSPKDKPNTFVYEDVTLSRVSGISMSEFLPCWLSHRAFPSDPFPSIFC